MAKINPGYDVLNANYLFPRVAAKRNEFQRRTGKKVMRLDIGDAKVPLGPVVSSAMALASNRLHYSTGFSYDEIKESEIKSILARAGYDKFNGYGDEQGCTLLRETVAKQYQDRGIKVSPSEILISDGAKSDTANIQSLFSQDAVVAVQDPAYPVYVDTNVIAGRGGSWDASGNIYTRFIYMPCNKGNGFLPDVKVLEAEKVQGRRADLIYLCSPNNPTGAVSPRAKVEPIVDWAIANKAIIMFDAAYSEFEDDPHLMKSIFEIERAKKCAIEFQSFSKSAGFTGVRLGWTVVPQELETESEIRYDTNGKPINSLNALWNGRQTRFFNGACNVAQVGGLVALLTKEGQAECRAMKEIYMGNAKLIRAGLESLGYEVEGGVNSPYLWFNTGIESWAFLDKLLEETQVSCTPGVGFGPSGAGYARLSAFALREDVEKAVDSIVKNLKK